MDIPSQNNQTQPIVHCGNLSTKTTSQELQSLFSKVAQVTKINLRRKANGVSAFAFAYFSSVQDAEEVIKEFNYHDLHGKQMNLMLYNADKDLPEGANIFVKNLPPNLNSKDLSEIFKMFGQIISCKVASDENGQLKGFGYVQYKSPKAAKKAIASCKSVKIGSYALEVELYDSKNKKTREEQEPVKQVFTNCYIKNFPPSMTEEKLKSILEEYGKINSLYFPLNDEGLSVGYACANFVTFEDALKAIENLHNKQMFTSAEMGKEEGLIPEPFYIQKAENKRDRSESLKKQYEKFSQEGKVLKRNLYVSNIPDTFTKDEIKSIFLKYGNVTDFKISPSAQDSGKQYGYVCYATAEEVCIAYEKLDGTSLDESKLQISYYKNKDERVNDNEPCKVFDHGQTSLTNSLKSLSIDESNEDRSSKSFYRQLYNSIYSVSSAYESSWNVLGATNKTDFVSKVMFSISETPRNLLKEMSNDTAMLEQHINKLIKANRSQSSANH